ncbi:MAG: hypothetical protein IT261_02760 [Saprospiraceae bacterium]|nr:hypothetical protein [Saprospiraceae bacterium]
MVKTNQMQTPFVPLLPGKVYHLFNHAVGTENLFRETNNFDFFLGKYEKYIYPVCRTFSYALMPNHFHFLIQVRQLPDISSLMPLRFDPSSETDCAKFVMQQFSNFFNAYAKAYNKTYKRRGALFNDYLRRVPVENHTQFVNTILYHHFNPVKHDFCSNPEDYIFTSYQAFFHNLPTIIERPTVISRFRGAASFHMKHQSYNWRVEGYNNF